MQPLANNDLVPHAQVPQLPFAPVPQRISRTELLHRMRSFYEDSPLALSVLCAANVTDYPAYCLVSCLYPHRMDELRALRQASAHLKSYSEIYLIASNAFYREKTSHINKTLVQPILKQFQAVTEFEQEAARRGPEGWQTHCGLLFFDSLETAVGAMSALADHLIFERTVEELFNRGRGWGIPWELKAWAELNRQHQEAFAQTIVDLD